MLSTHSLPLRLPKSLPFSPLSFSFSFSFQTKTEPNPNPIPTQLESCSNPSHLTQIHTQMVRTHLLFHSSFHFNSLMRSYLHLSLPDSALLLFPQMLRSAVLPDSYSLPLAFKAACRVFSLAAGRQLHAAAAKLGFDRDEYSESGLISLYSKAGEFGDAREVFDGNPERKLGSWNAVINGLAQGGRAEEAVGVFVEMGRSGWVPDGVTMVSVVSACGSLGGIGLAEQVHKCVLQVKGLERLDIMLSNSLIDMYSKCGRTDLALRVFSKMTQRNVSTWTTMIMGLAMHGQERLALDSFKRMIQEGVQPNHVTFVGVLSACAHGGLVDEGMEYLEKMEVDYGVKPTAAHYGCVVDMLGRVGRVEEARAVAETMPMGANMVVWGTLLGASEKHGSVAVGELAAAKLIELEPWNDGVYVVLSNIYSAVGMWGEAERVRRLMRERRVVKIPGYSLAAVGT